MQISLPRNFGLCWSYFLPIYRFSNLKVCLVTLDSVIPLAFSSITDKFSIFGSVLSFSCFNTESILWMYNIDFQLFHFVDLNFMPELVITGEWWWCDSYNPSPILGRRKMMIPGTINSILWLAPDAGGEYKNRGCTFCSKNLLKFWGPKISVPNK